MKLFQQLLVAPAALGLLAPLAANAAELNINEVSNYSATSEAVQGISQFSDVYPTDWAYQALTNLAERHGCVVSTSGGSMTRYEAAALLNTCLGNVSEVNDEERRLLNEFSSELAVVRGRIDGLEARIGEFEAGVFSTTTTVAGKVDFTVGGTEQDDDSNQAVTFNYRFNLDVNSSFNGRDNLYTRLRTGNFASGNFADSTGAYLNWAKTGDSTLKVDKLWYTFPVGDDFQVWVGAKIENYYMLASSPSVYRPILKHFKLGGYGAVYGASTGQGFGVAWTQPVEDRSEPRFAVSANYTASSDTGATSDETTGGILTDGAKGMFLSQISYGSPRWQVSAAYSYKTGDPAASAGYGTTEGQNRTGEANAIGLRAYWRPETSGAIPSISVGYDIADIEAASDGDTSETAMWMVGLTWTDAFVDGNTAGVAFGAPQYATDLKGSTDPDDENFTWEAWYTFKVSDSVTVTPAVFHRNDPASGSSDDVFGALVNTTFRF